MSDFQRNYRIDDMVRIDCHDCAGCSSCCRGMGESILLDPYDVRRLTEGLGKTMEELLEKELSLTVSYGLILPHLQMDPGEDHCKFLTVEGTCKIHDFRPGLCRLFPLGRTYTAEGVRYILQEGVCEGKNPSKIRIRKWLGEEDCVAYERFVTDWHELLVRSRERASTLTDEELKLYNMQFVKLFFLTPYQKDRDFFLQYERRKKMFERIAVDKSGAFS